MAGLPLIFTKSKSRGLYHLKRRFLFYVLVGCFCIYPFLSATRVSPAMEELMETGHWEVGINICFFIVQALGFILATFLEKRVATEMEDENCCLLFLRLTAVAGFSLLLFSLVPFPFNIPFLFTIGLPLGLARALFRTS